MLQGVFILICSASEDKSKICSTPTIDRFRCFRASAFRNQSCFAAGILLYGLYHAVYAPQLQTLMPQELLDYVDAANLEFMKATIKYGYLTVGILGGISQFGLAWYYRGAKASDG